MPTVILPCNCYSPFQDTRYGAGNRLHNQQSKDGKLAKKARGTVCSVSREMRVSVVRRNYDEEE